MAAWVAERVLPFLAKCTDDGDEEDSEKDSGKDLETSQQLAAQITEVSATIAYVNI